MKSKLFFTDKALHGLAGQIVNSIYPHTEASFAALLSQLLCAFGNVIGRSPHFITEADRHGTNLFVLNVGLSSKGRKGTSWGQIEKLFNLTEPNWVKKNIKSGLSTGEGLLWPLRDSEENEEEKFRPFSSSVATISDKRLLSIEPEFASILKLISREGNILSPIIRNAWDGKTLSSLTKNNPITVSDSHISIIGHITKQELIKMLTATEISNGFGNRFLFFFVERSKLLPEGGSLDAKDLSLIVQELKASIEFAKIQTEIKRTNRAREYWKHIYSSLSSDRFGLFGSLSSRSEAQVVRLSLIQSLINRKNEIDFDDLECAVAIHEYSLKSLSFIFGNQTGNSVADRIIEGLKESENGKLTRTQIRDLFYRNNSVGVSTALNQLEEQGVIRCQKSSPLSKGRPEEIWSIVDTPETYDKNDKNPQKSFRSLMSYHEGVS